MLLMSDSLCCIQILAPSPSCVMLCSVLQEQFFCPITDRFFHSFQLLPRLLVVAPHLQQDELLSLDGSNLRLMFRLLTLVFLPQCFLERSG